MKKLHNRFPLYAVILVFALPMMTAWFLFYFPDFLGGSTVNHGTLMSPVIQTKADSAHRWQVIYVPAGQCGKSCVETDQKLQQMVKLLGHNSRRVLTRRQPALAHQPVGRIYLVDPIGNIFMYYASSADPVDVYRDLKHLLNISQIG